MLRVTGSYFRVGGACYQWKFKDCNRVSDFYKKEWSIANETSIHHIFNKYGFFFLKKRKRKRKKSYEQSHEKYVNDLNKSIACEQKYFKFSWGWEIKSFEKTTEPLKKLSIL